MGKMNKLPYMIVVHTVKPQDGASTHEKNWKDRNEWTVNETAYFKDTISENLLLSADVIIDILNGRIVKNRITDVTAEQLVEHYMGKYSDKIVEAVREFFKKNPDHWERFVKEASQLAEELNSNSEQPNSGEVQDSIDTTNTSDDNSSEDSSKNVS